MTLAKPDTLAVADIAFAEFGVKIDDDRVADYIWLQLEGEVRAKLIASHMVERETDYLAWWVRQTCCSATKKMRARWWGKALTRRWRTYILCVPEGPIRVV